MNITRLYPPGVLDPEPKPRQDEPVTARSVYPTPDPFVSLEQYERLHHFDLDRMPLELLHRERRRAALREILDDEPDAWLAERLQHLDAAIKRSDRAARG